MMRFQQTFVTGLAALLVLPAVATLGDEPLDLVARLEQTSRAITRVAGLAERLQANDHDAVAEVLEATEPPILDGAERDANLVRLRDEVGALHQELDGLAIARPELGPGAPTSPGAAEATERRMRVTTGLGDGDRHALTRITGSEGDTRPRNATVRDFEQDPSYSADSLHQARLYLRLGRAPEAIGLLTPLVDDPEARYWLARAYARAELHDEALAIYSELGEDPSAGVYADRARIDGEFLRVKRELRTVREKGKEGS